MRGHERLDEVHRNKQHAFTVRALNERANDGILFRG
jgi:hypothetical protein